MYISPVTNSTDNENFKGLLKVKGKWPSERASELFQSNSVLQKALKNYEITAEMKSKVVNQYYGTKDVYKLVISAKKEQPNPWDKFKYMLGIYPKANLSKHHHGVQGTENLIVSRTSKTLIDKLNLDV